MFDLLFNVIRPAILSVQNYFVVVVVVVVTGCIPDGQSRYCFDNDKCCTGVCAFNNYCGKDSVELGLTHHSPYDPI